MADGTPSEGAGPAPGGTPAATAHTGRPALYVVGGSPTATELAVLTALVASAGNEAEPEGALPPPRGRWSDPAYGHRRPLHPGPNGWRATAR